MTRETKVDYFAIRPLATVLISMDDVPVRAYQSGEGLGDPVPTSFASIELDVWARQFLEAMDGFLTSLPRDYLDEWERNAREREACAPLAIPASGEKPTDGLWPDIERVACAYVEVTQAAAQGVDDLFQATDDPQALERVRMGVRHALLGGLSAGYGTDTLFEARAVLLYTHGVPAPSVRAAPSDTLREGIPVALRTYPALPVLAAQSVFVAQAPALDIDQARLWNYALDLEHPGEEQDSLYVSIVTNPPEGHASRPHMASLHSPPGASLPLARALAAFVSAYPAIRQDLPVPLNPGSQDTGMVGPALKALAELAEEVAAGWGTFWPGTGRHFAVAAGDAAARDESMFRLEKRYTQREDRRVLDAITLSLAGDAAKPPMCWPSLSVAAPDGAYHALTRVPSDENASVYICEDLPFDSDGAHLRFGLEALDVLQIWRIGASARVVRNENLGGIPAVNKAFVYRTPWVTFPNPIMALVLHAGMIALAQPTADLAASLADFLAKLFGEQEAYPDIQITVTYQQGLKQDALTGEGGVLDGASLPVLFMPQVSYDKALGTRLAEAVQKWRMENVLGEPGHFELDVAVFPVGSKVPVLHLERVVFSL